MSRFQPIVPNPDLDVHPNPTGAWARVAILCGWQDAKIARKRWPEAAVVGPFRTARGVDELVRNLLANPQIRLVLLDGPEGGAIGKRAREALREVFDTGRGVNGAEVDIDRLPTALAASLFDSEKPLYKPVPGDPLFEAVCLMLRGVWLLDTKHFRLDIVKEWSNFRIEGIKKWWISAVGDAQLPVGIDLRLDENRAGGPCFLPPPAPKPSDDMPSGDTGQRIAGATLVYVWPAVLAEVLRFGRKVPTQYGMTRELLNLVSVIRDPEATLAAFEQTGDPVVDAIPHPVLSLSWADVESYYQQLVSAAIPDGQSYTYGSRLRGAGIAFGPDQIEAVTKLLWEKPDTRAAFLTPWFAETDSGRESGRPCLVGVTFRAVGEPATLHMTVVFRSHDLHGAYPHNLAAACIWLVEEAKRQGMIPGLLTCISQSAHVYERDWKAAQDVVAAWKRPAIEWDPRANWRIVSVDRGRVRAEAMTPGIDGGDEVLLRIEGTAAEVERAMAASGLVTGVPHALWLGGEIAKAGMP